MDVHVSSYLTSQKGACRSDGFRLLRWGEFLGFSGWADVIIGVFIRERGRQESQRRGCDLGNSRNRNLKMWQLLTLKMEGGAVSRGRQSASRFARKHSPSSLWNGCGPDDPMIFSSVKPILYF